jgi:hypothetical protein
MLMGINFLKKVSILTLMVIVAAFNLRAAEKNDTVAAGLLHKSALLAEKILNVISFETEYCSFAVYPALGYSDRTGLEAGVMPILKFNERKPSASGFKRPSTVAPSLLVSTKGMYEADIDISIFTSNNKWSINNKLKFLYLPDTFFGIGNHDKKGKFTSFDSYKYAAVGELLRGINDRFFAGIQWDAGYYENKSIRNLDADPSYWLDGSVTGAAGGWSNGIGPVIRFDTRNDVVYPSNGWLMTASWLASRAFLGSDYDYDNFMLDIRRYFRLGINDQVLAVHGYVNSTDGDVPFFKLSTPAGKRLLRGIGHPYKYLASNAWLLQAEYRRNIWWRIGGVAFAGAGNAFGNSASSVFDKTHLMGGIGLRFKALPKENLNIRLDAGMTNRGDHAIFLSIKEAF